METNCETLRERLASDPASVDEAFERHAEACAACAAFRKRLERSESLIRKALEFDVDGVERWPHAAPAVHQSRSSLGLLASGIAAGLVVGLVLWSWFSGPANLTPEALAAEVVRHWYHEPDSWLVSDIEVSDAELSRVLNGKVELDLAALSVVSYIESCRVGGDRIPHLVVQGDEGPYMVLLMPGRMLESPVPIELAEQGLSGHIVPAAGGSIAVLGGGAADEVERVETMVASAVSWIS